MIKRKGQSLVDFAVLAMLAVSIIIFGLYQLGGSLGQFFSSSNPNKKFNNSRTVRFERPADLVSNITVKLGGTTIEPPVEKLIKSGLLSGSYIETSGSAGSVMFRGAIINEYTNLLNSVAVDNSTTQYTDLMNKLSDLKNSFTNGGSTGFLDTYSAIAPTNVLEQKITSLEMMIETQSGTSIPDIAAALSAYLGTLTPGNTKSIIESFGNDLIAAGNNFSYNIDDNLYVNLLGQEKNNTAAQDQTLIAQLKSMLGGLTDDQKQYYAGLINVNVSSGYVAMSPAGYNGMKLCTTYSGTIASGVCDIDP